ncbi:NAC domain-containing protein 68-like [Malus sylvestris]|uniref:NAC domain-containing protein 68-like n=1 Tax=Malus sylvestris TaxID=3752 RepID=UPI0021AC588D|nr:NAC domain-containing protein 68-like [Malus sylvestris]
MVQRKSSRLQSVKEQEKLETDPIELRRKQLILDIREANRIGDQNEEKRRIRLIHETEMVNKLSKAMKIRDLQVQLISLGYTFNPEDGLLVCHYLREKCLDGDLLFHSIEDADVYAKHPQNLIDKYKAVGARNVWYFFTRTRPNETQPGTSTSTEQVLAGKWIFGNGMDVLHQGEKVGVKQLLEYCDGDAKTQYKIIEYKLDPLPDNLKSGPWFVCKLYNDASCVEVQSLING